MKHLPGIFGALATLVALIYLFSSGVMLLSDSARQDSMSFTNRVVALGCEFDAFALPLLIVIFLLLAVEVFITFRNAEPAEDRETWTARLKRLTVSSPNPSLPLKTLAAFNRLLLVVFFISQLSYLWSYCQAGT